MKGQTKASTFRQNLLLNHNFDTWNIFWIISFHTEMQTGGSGTSVQVEKASHSPSTTETN